MDTKDLERERGFQIEQQAEGPKMRINLGYLKERKKCTLSKSKHGRDEVSRGQIR